MTYPNILEQNIYDKGFKGKFLVIGSCLPGVYPEVIKKFEKEWHSVFTFCLEQFHYNLLTAKLFDILAVGNTRKVGFLTVDGSPHCVQMHFASKYLKRGLKIQTIDYQHYVIRKDGKVFEVRPELIDRARDFSSIGKEIKLGKKK